MTDPNDHPGPAPTNPISQAVSRTSNHAWFLECLDRVERAMRSSDDLELMLGQMLEVTREIFEADRAFASYPLDPDAREMDAPYIATAPQYALPPQKRHRVPIPPGYVEEARRTLAADGPVSAGEGLEYPVEPVMAEMLQLRSVLTVAVRPKVGSPWSFGVSQCSHPRVWTTDEHQLLQELGRRLGDTLTTLLKHRELEASEGRFRALFEQIADAVFLFDEEGRILDANPQACAQTGRKHSELLRMTYAEIEASGVDGGSPFWRASLTTQRMAAERLLHAHGGDPLPVEFSFARAVVAGLQVVIATARDISERRRAERQRERLEAQLRQSQKMEAVGQLAGGVAHDFNNLLTAIQGNLQLISGELSRGIPSTSVAEDLQQALDSVSRASQLTRQLLLFSRRDRDSTTTGDVNRTVEGLSALLNRLLPETISIKLSLSEGLRPVGADASQLEQIVVNLAVNARDSMPEGGLLSIETAAVDIDDECCRSHAQAHPGPHVLISVADTGSGIAPEITQRIFEPFFTTKPVGRGSGLGLATCYAIARQHGGFISMYTEVGQGTVFKVFLPALKEDLPNLEPIPRCSEAPRGMETILLCEDDRSVRRVARRILGEAGYDVLIAEHGQVALEIAARHPGPIHLLVTDVIMPEMNGPQLADAIIEVRPATRILYVSGYTSNMLIEQGSIDGHRQFLSKPYSRGALLSAVRSMLDAHLSIQE